MPGLGFVRTFLDWREAEGVRYLADSMSPGPEGPPPDTCVGQIPDSLVQPPFPHAAKASVVAERRAGRACFAEVKEESYSPLAACRTGDSAPSMGAIFGVQVPG